MFVPLLSSLTRIVVLWGCTIIGLGFFSPALAQHTDASQRAFDIEQHFRPFSESWTGADGIYSVALGHDRFLWFFGDTLVGQVKNMHRSIEGMPHNTLAIQTGQHWDYFWHKEKDQPGDVFVSPKQGHWFWPGPGTMYQKKLYLILPEFALDLERSDVFFFKQTGLYLAVVNNPEQAPELWQISYHQLNWGLEQESFSVAGLVNQDYFYIFGYSDHKKPLRQAKVLRIALHDLADGHFEAEEYWHKTGWQPEVLMAEPIFDGFQSEASAHWLPELNAFGLVYTAPDFSGQILLRTAPQIQGPWSESKVLYAIPEMEPRIFCYAGKHHPHLARSNDELVLSYACNAYQPALLEKDASIYLPRFVRVSLSGL